MSLQIIMSGKDPIPTLDKVKGDISAFCVVLNFKSTLPFIYYNTKKLINEVLQDAVKNAPNTVSHILYLSNKVVLTNYTYTFEEEKQYDIVCDNLDFNKCHYCLLRVNKDSRLDISKLKKNKIAENILDYTKINITPQTEDIMKRLLQVGCDFDDTVRTIHLMNTKHDRPQTPRIFIGTPCFEGKVYCNYTSSLIKTLDLLRENGIDYEVHFMPNQIVTRARNILAYEFLSGNFTHLLFIDADIQWKPQDVIKLINHKKELVVGLYANKSYLIVESNNFFKKIQYSSTFFPENNIMDKNKLMEIKHGATGFMLIERCVFEKVIDLAPEFKYSSHTMNDFFPCKVVDGDYLTEDYAFCQIWREKGGKIWADLSVCLNHEGWHSYHGNPLKTFEISQ